MLRDIENYKPLTKRQFERLNPSQKRVAIAKDVLAQLQLKKLMASQGQYFAAPIEGQRLTQRQLEGDLGKVLRKTPKCEVCALGGMFVAAVETADCAPVSEYSWGETVSLGGMRIRSYLLRFFSEEQLAMIEAAFEGEDIGYNMGKLHIPSETRQAAIGYNTNIKQDRARLTRIMRNIIRHDGEFDPFDSTLATR